MEKERSTQFYLLEEGNNYFRLHWKKLSLFSFMFFTILLLDALFIFYFLFNFFFIINETPQNNFCLYDEYITFLSTEHYEYDASACRGFFRHYSNINSCDGFDSLSDFCKFVFRLKANDFSSCESYTDRAVIRECEYYAYLPSEVDIIDEYNEDLFLEVDHGI